jgi:DNA-binding NarL/FixJ family response regulator
VGPEAGGCEVVPVAPGSEAAGGFTARVLIVDDESLARRSVVQRLRRFKDVEIIGEWEDGVSAVERILKRSPDGVFPGVQMPGIERATLNATVQSKLG